MPICLPSFAGTAQPASGGTPYANQYSVSLDGSDDYMSIPDADIFSMGNGSGTDNAFSISAWFNADNIASFYFATKDVGGSREWDFRTVGSQLHFFAFGTGGGYIGRKYSTNLNTGRWYHAVVTYDASKASSGIKLYLNGTRVDDADYASGTFTASKNTSTEVRVGGLEIGPGFSNGLIDEVAIFNSELSVSNVSSMYNGGVPNDISSLSPVGWWRMGENDGGSGTTITDQGSGSNNGTLENGPTFSTVVPEAPLPNQYSISLDGSDDYMDIPDSTALETTAFTWSAWFYCTAINRHNPIVDTSTSVSNYDGYHIRVNTTNNIRFVSYSASNFMDSTTAVSANTWYHVVATHEAGSDKLYVNGTLEASGSASSFSMSDAANLRVGSASIYSMYHQGLIDEVSFFNSALSASNVTAIYNGGLPNDIGINGLNLNPVGWWRMGDNDGGTGTTITDQGSGSNDGTLTNGPTFSTTVPS